MKPTVRDTALALAFPKPPIEGDHCLVPIRTWPEMLRETNTTGVEFDAYWLQAVEERVAYLFSWIREPRCTVLVVWGEDGVKHVECRKSGDLPLSATESREIAAHVEALFISAGVGTQVDGHA